jgi:hypothetical protein
MSNAREFVELGSLMSYGASITNLVRHSAVYVNRAPGLTIPPLLLGRADEVIR